MHAAGVHAKAGGDFVEQPYRAALAGQGADALEEAGGRFYAAYGFHDDGRQLVAVLVDDGRECLEVVEVERMQGAREPARHTRRLEAGQQVALQLIAAAEVHRQIPIVPAVIPAKSDLVAAGGGPGDADGFGHHFAPRSGVGHHLGPGVQLEQ